MEEYVLNDNPITIKLTADKVTDVTIKNEKIKGKVEITKVDKKDNSKFLEGVKFGLYDKNNKLIETLITDKTRKGH